MPEPGPEGGPKFRASPAFRSALTLPEPSRPAGAWLELRHIRHLMWSPYTVTIPDLPPPLVGLRILHLTDLHVDARWMPAWDELHQRIKADAPDLILITGDFVEAKYDSRPALPLLRRLLDGLSARLGVWGILGNHDGDVLGISLADMNVRLLVNQMVTLQSAGAMLQLIGVHGVTRYDLSARARKSIPAKPPGAVRLLLAHYPDQIGPLASLDADILFAGHTHGGQACMPGGLPLITHDTLPRRFSKGVHRMGRSWLAVGRGLGFSTHHLRVFCPAEAIELTLAAT